MLNISGNPTEAEIALIYTVVSTLEKKNEDQPQAKSNWEIISRKESVSDNYSFSGI